MKQYESVYTTPRTVINDWNEFFINGFNCSECEREVTHFCHEDNHISEFCTEIWIDEVCPIARRADILVKK